MNTLHLKFHPACLAYFINSENYGIIPITTNLIENCDRIYLKLYQATQGYLPMKIVVEKPFLKLIGADNSVLASSIILVQRNFGALLYILHQLFPATRVMHVSARTARESVYATGSISKDTQLTEVAVLLRDIKEKNLTPLQHLCLHDCLVLASYGRTL